MNTEQRITAYKAFGENLTCRGYQFTVGEVHAHEGLVKACQSGFHSCTDLKDVYNYYPFDMHTPVYKVEIWGDLDESNEDESKVASRYIKLVQEVTLEEKLSHLNLFCHSNRGSDNRGSDNSGSYNSGSYNSGSDNRGSDNSGSDNRGSENRGSYNSGSYNSGSYNSGSDNRGSYNSGSDNSGSYNSGSDNSGSDNRGSHNLGTKSVGFLNTVSFVGDKTNCYCFNKATGMSLMSFAKKYLGILKELKKGVYKNVSNLPNYDKELFEKMRIYI